MFFYLQSPNFPREHIVPWLKEKERNPMRNFCFTDLMALVLMVFELPGVGDSADGHRGHPEPRSIWSHGNLLVPPVKIPEEV